jgi:hypothetical protein
MISASNRSSGEWNLHRRDQLRNGLLRNVVCLPRGIWVPVFNRSTRR